jgi:hypothetical protein
MRKGDKLICKNDINNVFGWPLFEKNKEYKVLYVDNESIEIMVTIEHNLYGNEYKEYPIEWVKQNFKYVKG